MERAMRLTKNTLPDPAPSLYNNNSSSLGILTKSSSKKNVLKNTFEFQNLMK
jgi:hypothetical protein